MTTPPRPTPEARDGESDPRETLKFYMREYDRLLRDNAALAAQAQRDHAEIVELRRVAQREVEALETTPCLEQAPIMLSQKDRDRFAAFLEQEAATQEGIATQLAGLPTKEVGEQMAKKYRTEALAFRVVAKWLGAWESQEVRA